MPFMRLNGITIPVTPGSVQARTLPFGPRARMHSGDMRDGKRGFIDQYPGRTKPLTWERANVIRKLIEGRGHVWAFDSDLYTSRGLGPSSAPSVTLNTTGGKFGGHIIVGTGTSLIYTLPTKYEEWSLMFYSQPPPGGGAWVFYIHDSTGYARKNDAALGVGELIDNMVIVDNTGATTVVDIMGQDIDGTPGNQWYDSVVLLPYVLTAADFTDLYNWDQAPGLLPTVKLDGDIVDADSLLVKLTGNVQRDYTPFGDGTAWQSNGQTLGFVLESESVEVDE